MTSEHEVSSFDCGKQPINDYLIRHALVNSQRGISRCFVFCEPNNNRVLAFYSLAGSNVQSEGFPRSINRGLPRYPIPVVLLAQMGLVIEKHGMGLGRQLLWDVYRRFEIISKEIGAYALATDALDDAAKTWYVDRGFRAFVGEQRKLYVTGKQIRRNLEALEDLANE